MYGNYTYKEMMYPPPPCAIVGRLIVDGPAPLELSESDVEALRLMDDMWDNSIVSFPAETEKEEKSS